MHTGPIEVSGSRESFLSAMARAVNGVAVIATDGPAGRFGLTVSSVVSVSADPPMVLVCLNRSSVAHAAVGKNGVFSISLLSTEQKELSDAFAGRPSRGEAYDFDDGTWYAGPLGSPLLRGAVAVFDCALEQAHDAGSHTVFIGRVTGVVPGAGDPLLYTARAYGRPMRWTQPPHGSSNETAARHPAVA